MGDAGLDDPLFATLKGISGLSDGARLPERKVKTVLFAGESMGKEGWKALDGDAA